MREAHVFMYGDFTGKLREEEDGVFTFCYDAAYLKKKTAKPVSLTLPLQEEAYHSEMLFPFFDGLIPEGWLLDLSVKNWKLNRTDRMGLLMMACGDCIGAVHVVPKEENSHDK